ARIKELLPMIKSKFFSLAEKQIWLYDHSYPGLDDMKFAIEQTKPNIVMIDYLQILNAPRSETRRLEVSNLVLGIKTIAKEFSVPIILLAQLNRETDKRLGPPVMADLVETGTIEAASDFVALAWEPKPKNKEEIAQRNSSAYKPIHVTIGKNRHGLRKKFVLELSKDTTAVRQAINAPEGEETELLENLDLG
ncbi:MAG: DnaB-like helicase C-terminal domain-containing protein, partial [Patescibacteria group bacterium]